MGDFHGRCKGGRGPRVRGGGAGAGGAGHTLLVDVGPVRQSHREWQRHLRHRPGVLARSDHLSLPVGRAGGHQAGAAARAPGRSALAGRDGGIGIGTFHVLWNITVLINGVGISTVLQCNSPVFVTVFAWLLWREPLTWRKWAAIALAGIGTILIARPGALTGVQLTALGLSTALAASLAYSGITLFTKKLAGNYEPWTILVYAFGFAALALLPFQIGRPLPGPISPTAAGAFLALVLITTIMGYRTYTSGLRRIQASVASIVATSEVPMASLLGYVFLAERMDGWQIVGAGLVVSGVILLSLNGRRPRLKVR
ncbi:MAG: hypothetical protein CVU38_19610 [Chloroflexi bacterium HGW-Chloroflexi-1]|nr:MAG: hypothetical protein CVU38_19610 [Chloroflexi bacterium HGW-Chloroflexi-1]